jgi:hypothetical protein
MRVAGQRRTHEEIVCGRAEAANGKELHEVEELAMDVPPDLRRVWVKVDGMQRS